MDAGPVVDKVYEDDSTARQAVVGRVWVTAFASIWLVGKKRKSVAKSGRKIQSFSRGVEHIAARE